MRTVSRRALLASSLVPRLLTADRTPGPLVDTHLHLFASDRVKFPFSPSAPYQPPPQTLEDYVRFAEDAGITHGVIVHPEPYQDDHRYLEYCFAKERPAMFFKGTCLFDPAAPETPDRMEALVRRNPDRIVALRIHEVRRPGTPASASGPIKDRDLRSPGMAATWRRVQKLKLAIQMHFLPYFAPQVGALKQQFPDVPVILDHLGRVGEGTPADLQSVLQLAKLPGVYIKYSDMKSSSKQPYPYKDAQLLVRQIYDAFGPKRMIWGGLGYNREEFDQQVHLFEDTFHFAGAEDRELIRGANALRLYGWKS